MHYYSTDDRKGRIVGGVAAFLYIAAWLLVFFLVTFKVEEESHLDGIMLDLVGDPGETASSQALATSQTPVEQTSDEDIMTQDTEEAPAVRPQPQPKPKPRTEPQEQPRKADPNALFRPSNSNTEGGTAASTETGGGSGGYDGQPTGTGGGGIDSEYSVGDRSLVGSLPLPSTNYGKNKHGDVVVEIYVDENGKVTQASYRARGSTTNDNELVRVALEAARKARFTKGKNDIPEMGTITYRFKLN